MESGILIFIIAFVAVFVLQLFFFISRYKKVSPNQILVIYGRVSADPNEKYKIVTHGSTFVWPVIQEFKYLNTSSHRISIDKSFLTKDNCKVKFQGGIDYCISSDENLITRVVDLIGAGKEKDFHSLVERKVNSQIEKALALSSSETLASVKITFFQQLESSMKSELAGLGLDCLNMELPKLELT